RGAGHRDHLHQSGRRGGAGRRRPRRAAHAGHRDLVRAYPGGLGARHPSQPAAHRFRPPPPPPAAGAAGPPTGPGPLARGLASTSPARVAMVGAVCAVVTVHQNPVGWHGAGTSRLRPLAPPYTVPAFTCADCSALRWLTLGLGRRTGLLM